MSKGKDNNVRGNGSIGCCCVDDDSNSSESAVVVDCYKGIGIVA
jgi:hypothetical protein